jgi:hypothetical protein
VGTPHKGRPFIIPVTHHDRVSRTHLYRVSVTGKMVGGHTSLSIFVCHLARLFKKNNVYSYKKGAYTMSTTKNKRVPWYLWPFKALWDLLSWILGLTGRLIGAILGLVLLILGVLLTMTIVAAPVGIPIALFGFLIMLRSIF